MSTITKLPEPLQQRIRAELKSGETLTWLGQPNPNRMMKSGIVATLFFIPWTAFSLFWMAGAAGFSWPQFNSEADMFRLAFPLFGLPFLGIGIWGLSGPLRIRRNASYTVYALSNQRAFSITGIKSFTVTSFSANDIAETVRTEHADGSGDLVLRKENHKDNDGDNRTKLDGFFAIEDVRKVEKLVESLTRMNRL